MKSMGDRILRHASALVGDPSIDSIERSAKAISSDLHPPPSSSIKFGDDEHQMDERALELEVCRRFR